MTKPHKWAKEIKAWADGEIIEYRWIPSMHASSNWSSVGQNEIDWNLTTLEFRIKPQPKEPQYLYVYRCTGDGELRLHENKDLEGSRWKLKGKIKLEVNDDN